MNNQMMVMNNSNNQMMMNNNMNNQMMMNNSNNQMMMNNNMNNHMMMNNSNNQMMINNNINNQMMMNNNMNNQMMNNSNNQMMMNNSNNQMMINKSNNQMMINKNNNQIMMNNNINQMGNNKMKELLEELDYMRNKVNLYEKRIKTLEERIKEKDSEINNLINLLSSNSNQYIQPFNYNHYPMMMGQMNNFMNSGNQANTSNNMAKENSSKYITINFIFDGHKIAALGNSKMTIKGIINNFRIKLSIEDFSGDYYFKGNKIDKDSKLTLEQSGISNEDYIYVFDQNDKNQKEKISKILSHKYDNITIIFESSVGFKAQISLSYYTKISKAFKLYCKKIGIGKAAFEKGIFFIYNGENLKIHDNRTIEEISGYHNFIKIIVIDPNNIIGA